MQNTVLNDFMAAFSAKPRHDEPASQGVLEAREDLTLEVERALERGGCRARLEFERLEVMDAPGDREEAGRVASSALERHGWPLVWLDRTPWGYGLVASREGGRFALGGVIPFEGKSLVWLSPCELRRVAA